MQGDERGRINRSHRLHTNASYTEGDIEELEKECNSLEKQNESLRNTLWKLVNASKNFKTELDSDIYEALSILDPNFEDEMMKQQSIKDNTPCSRVESLPVVLSSQLQDIEDGSQFTVVPKKEQKDNDINNRHRRSRSGDESLSSRRKKPKLTRKRSSIHKLGGRKKVEHTEWTKTLRGKDAVIISFKENQDIERYNLLAFVENFIKMLPDEHPIECYQGCCSLSKHGDGCFYPANGEPICGTWFNDDCIEHHHHFLSAEEKKLHMNQYHPNSKEIILSPGREPGPINYFNSLLPHLQLQIFSYFDIPTLVHCGLVCRSWYKLSRYSTLWCRLYLERWGVSENFDGNSNTTWIQVYRDKHVLQENWDTGNCHSSVLNGHSGWVTCVDMNNNRLISSSYDGTVRVWNTQTGNSLQVLGPLDSASPVWCTQFKSSNIIAGYSDSIVRQWNTNTAQCIREFYGHAGGVKCLQVR